MPQVTEHAGVAVIATTYTSDRLAGTLALLDGLCAQTVHPARLVIVVQRDPGLVESIRRAASRLPFPAVVIFRADINGLAAARNAALSAVAEPIVAFIDDDAVPDSRWVEEIQRAFVSDKIVGLTGPADPIWIGRSLNWIPSSAYWLFSCTGGEGWDNISEVRNAWGSNMAFRLEAIRKVGAFDPNAGLVRGGQHTGLSEDVDISLRIRSETEQAIVFDPEVRIGHRVQSWRLSSHFVLDRAAWVAAIDRVVRRRYPKLSSSAVHASIIRQMARAAVVDFLTWPFHASRNSQRLRLWALIALGALKGWLMPWIVLQGVRKRR